MSQSWMIQDSTLAAINQIRIQLENGEDKVRLAVSARKEFGSERTGFLITQAELQLRARAKFTRADQMLFTRVGLEQATSEVIANVKARWVDDQQSSTGHDGILDICCGVGGDAIGLGQKQNLLAVDRDADTCLFAEHNLRQYGVQDALVSCSEFSDLTIPGKAFVHIDPDRRTKGRTVRAENFSPDFFSLINQLELANPNSERSLCIKVAPVTQLDFEVPRPVNRHWIGHRRECKQQLLWMGPRVLESHRTVSIIQNDGTWETFRPEEVPMRQVVSSELKEIIYEPHSAILAADIVDALASNISAGRLSYDSVYLTGTDAADSPFYSTFRILEICPMKQKAVAAAVKAHDLGTIEWKNRGVDAAAVKKISKTKCSGSQPGVVILTRLGQKYLALVCQRVR